MGMKQKKIGGANNNKEHTIIKKVKTSVSIFDVHEQYVFRLSMETLTLFCERFVIYMYKNSPVKG